MRSARRAVTMAVAAALLAALVLDLVAAPGFLSDRDSTVPLEAVTEAGR